MYTAQEGNLIDLIEELKLDGLMNAANGTGPMGRGIAGAIRKAGGDEIMHDAFTVCEKENPQPGQAYWTTAGGLERRGIKCIIHAVTMKLPGGYTSYDIVKTAFWNAIDLAKIRGITRFGCTALSTGVGGLDPRTIAEIMGCLAIEEKTLEICFVDFRPFFINTLNEMKDSKPNA